jgi:hypothetical protein
MSSNIKHCQYPVLQKYFDENEYMEVVSHIMECNHCLNQVISLDHNLLLANKARKSKEIVYDENELAVKIEALENAKNDSDIAEMVFKNTKIPAKTIIDMYNYINNTVNDNIKTPDFLRNIVQDEMTQKESRELPNIIIKITNGLKIIGNYIDNIIIIPEEMVPVAVRSGIRKSEKNSQGSINFVQILEAGRAHYNVIKDGSESVLLTISFEDENQPDYINLKSQNQIVLSQRLNNNYAYFSKLKEGNYCIELKYRSKAEVLSIPITIV